MKAGKAVVQSAYRPDRFDQLRGPLVRQQHGARLRIGPALGYREKDEERQADGVVDQHGQREYPIGSDRVAPGERYAHGDEQQREDEEVGAGVPDRSQAVRHVVELETKVPLEPMNGVSCLMPELRHEGGVAAEPCLETGLHPIDEEGERQQTCQSDLARQQG